MVVDDRGPSLAVSTEGIVVLEDMIQNSTGDVRLKTGVKKSVADPVIRASNGPLIIKDNVVDVLKKITYVECKGKSIVYENEVQSTRVTRNSTEKLIVDLSASSSEMKIYVNRFGYSNAISEPVLEIYANSGILVNRNMHFEDSLTTKEVGFPLGFLWVEMISLMLTIMAATSFPVGKTRSFKEVLNGEATDSVLPSFPKVHPSLLKSSVHRPMADGPPPSSPTPGDVEEILELNDMVLCHHQEGEKGVHDSLPSPRCPDVEATIPMPNRTIPMLNPPIPMLNPSIPIPAVRVRKARWRADTTGGGGYNF
ncbi:hypothetical protein MA16_Dca015732 [Dendrobium catenatum]|uniref:Uncharacterized protein n=1 Tax=Dendrobium catenatum TaxID=906689 RepID=A0A2I0WHS2_9ASPA|nr:hypothetical protein MA16_Dca015732 [Dendrobium catenatum]